MRTYFTPTEARAAARELPGSRRGCSASTDWSMRRLAQAYGQTMYLLLATDAVRAFTPVGDNTYAATYAPGTVAASAHWDAAREQRAAEKGKARFYG